MQKFIKTRHYEEEIQKEKKQQQRKKNAHKQVAARKESEIWLKGKKLKSGYQVWHDGVMMCLAHVVKNANKGNINSTNTRRKTQRYTYFQNNIKIKICNLVVKVSGCKTKNHEFTITFDQKAKKTC